MNKIAIFGVLAAIMLIVTAASAAALSVSPSPLTVGDRNTRASNSRSFVEDGKNTYVTGTITVTNDGNETLNNLRLGTIVPKLGFSTTDVNVSAVFSATTLAANASTTATISVRVPDKLDAVLSSTLQEAAFNVADYNVLGTGAPSGNTVSVTPQLFAQRRNQLTIKEIEVCVNDRCKTVKDNGNIENIRPGDQMSAKVVIENRYSTSDREDLDIEDADLELEIDDSDFDLSERETLSSISANGETEESFDFDVNDDVRDGTYKMTAKVYGRDELGAFMGEEMEIRLKVQRDSHDIEIRRATVSPGTYPCSATTTSARTGRVTISATNIGRQDERKVAFEVSSPELGIKERVEAISMDRDDSRTETLTFTLPDTAKSGTYQLAVKSFFDNTAQSDAAQVPIVVSECTGTSTSTTGSSASTTTGSSSSTTSSSTASEQAAAAANAALLAQLSAVQNQLSDLRNQPPASAQTVPTTTVRSTTSTPTKSTALPWVSGFANSGLYIALLSGVIVLIIIVLIALIIKFLAPRP
ncbi:MAG: hypothetical protein AABX47_06515 [Nanoarchaeota archaeon]